MAKTESVTVYTYDSFASKGGLGEVVKAELEKRNGTKTVFVSFASAGEALNQVVLEGKSTRADLVVGVDATLLARARESGAFEKPDHRPPFSSDLDFDKEAVFTPFDYGYVAILYDSRRTKLPAETMSFREYARNPSFKKRLVIEDARTSSLGLSFLVWTEILYPGKEGESFWNDLTQVIFAVSPGWSGAYAMFLKKEADYVVSYTTSPAYHIEKENNDAIRAIPFREGHFRQVEGVGMVKHGRHKDLAKLWIDTLLSEPVQAKVGTTQWMYPALKSAPLPDSFKKLISVPKVVEADPALVETSRKDWLKNWTLRMMKNH